MKLNTLLFAAACAGTLLTTSCNPTMSENQLKYTHTTLVDNDAYQFFQVVGGKIPYEADYASYAEGAASGQAKDLAAKLKETFTGIVPELDTLATRYHVDFPIRGAEEFTAPTTEGSVATAVTADSTATEVASTHGSVYSDEAYISHVQHELAEIKKQFQRLSRNTNKDLRDYAASKLVTIDELYKLAGGKEDEHAHH